jgi:hypothetical protein
MAAVWTFTDATTAVPDDVTEVPDAVVVLPYAKPRSRTPMRTIRTRRRG